jgi:hypothetical protein
MAKSAAARKAAQRARQAAAGGRKMELVLDSQEVEMLAQNCALRRPQREPYDMDEYITMLIRKDNAELQAQLAEQGKRTCRRCGDALPGDKQGCAFIGEGACWQTMGWHETKLRL